jgi:hypothetical protein
MQTRKFEDHLWQVFVREHGDDLVQLNRPPARHSLRRPRVVAVAALGVAGVASALALVLSSVSAPPAFAVTLNHNGTVTVAVRSAKAIAGANERLSQLGIKARVMAAAPAGCQSQAVAEESAGGGPNPTEPIGNGGTTWTFNPSAVGRNQSLVLTPPATGSTGIAGNSGSGSPDGSSIWTCTSSAVAEQSAGGGPNPTEPTGN